MKAAAEFAEEHKGKYHQHPLKQHTRNAAKEHYQNQRYKAEQEAVRGVLIEFPVIFRNGSCAQEPFHNS